jgi:hypothetical protein
MKSVIVTVPEKINYSEFGLDEKKSSEITTGLTPFIQEREILIQEFNNIKDLEITEDNTFKFKELRLKFVKNRTQGIVSWHKSAKEIPLRMSQLIDAIKRNEIKVNETIEAFLETAENHFLNLEKERRAKIKEDRMLKLTPYVEFVAIGYIDIENMPEEEFLKVLESAKIQLEQKLKLQEEQEKQAKIKAEFDAKINERKIKIAPYTDFTSQTFNIETISDEDFEKFLSELKIAKENYFKESEKIRKEHELSIIENKRKEQERSELEQKLKEAKEREEQLIKEKNQKIEEQLGASDKSKVDSLIKELLLIKTKYVFKSNKNKIMFDSVCTLIDKIVMFINK